MLTLWSRFLIMVTATWLHDGCNWKTPVGDIQIYLFSYPFMETHTHPDKSLEDWDLHIILKNQIDQR